MLLPIYIAELILVTSTMAHNLLTYSKIDSMPLNFDFKSFY